MTARAKTQLPGHLSPRLRTLVSKGAEKLRQQGELYASEVDHLKGPWGQVDVSATTFRRNAGDQFTFSLGEGQPQVKVGVDGQGSAQNLTVNPRGITWGVIPEYTFANIGGTPAAFSPRTSDYEPFSGTALMLRQAQRVVDWNGTDGAELVRLVRDVVDAARTHATAYEDQVDMDLLFGR